VTISAPPQAPGTAYLKFNHNGSDTVLARAFATSPVKVFETKASGTACWAYAASLGGGLVGGDQIRMTVEVAAGARALLMTQASTKVYRSLRPATQVIAGAVDAGGLLVVVPDPVVCFAAADFSQSQRYDLREDASLVVVDWMTSGRHASGERWAFSRYESRIVVARNTRPIFWDAVVLERDLDPIVERMGRFEVLLTAVLTGPLVSDAAEMIVDRVAPMAIARQQELIVSASKLRGGGALLRMAGVSVEQVGRTLRSFFTFLPPLLGDDPWSRKW
jgi:urease accessory protein